MWQVLFCSEFQVKVLSTCFDSCGGGGGDDSVYVNCPQILYFQLSVHMHIGAQYEAFKQCILFSPHLVHNNTSHQFS